MGNYATTPGRQIIRICVYGDWSAKMAEIVPIPHNVSCSLDVCRCVHSAWVMWNVETPNDVSAVRAAVLSAAETAAASMHPKEEVREISDRDRRDFGLAVGEEEASLNTGKHLQLVHRTKLGYRDLITFQFNKDPDSNSIAVTAYGVTTDPHMYTALCPCCATNCCGRLLACLFCCCGLFPTSDQGVNKRVLNEIAAACTDYSFQELATGSGDPWRGGAAKSS